MSKRFAFLDGVRSLSALYVFGTHAAQMQIANVVNAYPLIFDWGTEAVATFIVLSGFCLGLQLDRTQDFWAYIGRRSRRLLPPYFAALGLLLFCLMLQRLSLGITLPLDWQLILPNLLLVRELFPQSDTLIGSAPFWSVGIEYRIYWLLPIMSWCDRRWSFAGLGMSAIGFYLLAAAILASFHLPSGHTWFILLFAFGVAASRATKALSQVLTIFLLALTVLTKGHIPTPISEILFGVGIALALLQMSHAQMPRLATALSSAWLGWLATWSYSLYLMHYGALRYANLWLRSIHIDGWAAIALETIPVLALCYLFSLIFERPFLRRRQA